MGYGEKNTGSQVKIVGESAATAIYKWKVVQYEWLVTTRRGSTSGCLGVTGQRAETGRWGGIIRLQTRIIIELSSETWYGVHRHHVL